MAINWLKPLPRWGGEVIEPPEAKKTEGWIAGDKPPAKWWNWYMKLMYEAVNEQGGVIEGLDTRLTQDVLNLTNHTSNNTNAHGATSSPTASKIVLRNSAGKIFSNPLMVLFEDGQNLNLSARIATGYVSNPTATSARIMGADEAGATREVVLLQTTRATSANTAVYGLYLLTRYGTGKSVIPIINDASLTVTINASYTVTISSGGTAELLGSLISIGG